VHYSVLTLMQFLLWLFIEQNQQTSSNSRHSHLQFLASGLVSTACATKKNLCWGVLLKCKQHTPSNVSPVPCTLSETLDLRPASTSSAPVSMSHCLLTWHPLVYLALPSWQSCAGGSYSDRGNSAFLYSRIKSTFWLPFSRCLNLPEESIARAFSEWSSVLSKT